MLKRHSQLMTILLGSADVLIVVAAWACGYGIRALGSVRGWSRHATPAPETFVAPMLLCAALTVLVFGRFELYAPRRIKTIGAEIAGVLQAVIVTWALTYIAGNFMHRVNLSRLMMGGVLASWLILAPAARLTARAVLRRLRRKGWNLRHAAIIGAGRLAQTLHHTLEQNAWTGIKTRYFVDDGDRERLAGREVLGPLEDLPAILDRRPVDIVFVALAADRHDRLQRVLDDLSTASVDVRVLPDLLSFHFLRHDIAQLDNLPIIGLTSSPHEGWNATIKRGMDILGGGAALALFALPMLLIALAIKLTSPGPVLFRQKRASLDGQPFDILKFRTMRPDAEQQTGAVWAERDDPRVTPIGRFLRRTSLDELPQLFNVVGGAMSLVGPRPERPELIERFRRQVPRYMLRSRVKAGLTGWAQVHGLRGRTSLRKRVQYDLHYITHWSVALDLWILLLTPVRGFIHPNAY